MLLPRKKEIKEIKEAEGFIHEGRGGRIVINY